MNYTSVEQSKKLLELGLSPESADMAYRYCICKVQNGVALEDWLCELGTPFDECPDEQIPCWSVGALIKLLPHDIIYQVKPFEPIHCMLNLSKTGVGYSSSIDRYPDRSFNQCWIENPDLVDALYNCMVWLLENNHIKKGR